MAFTGSYDPENFRDNTRRASEVAFSGFSHNRSFNTPHFTITTIGEAATQQIVETVVTPVPVYRGLVGSEYVTSVGSPPSGATFITIIGFQ